MSWQAILSGILGLAVTALGVWILRHPSRVADFYRGINRPLLGSQLSTRVFTERGAKLMGAYACVFGSLFVIMAVLATASGA